MEPLTSNTSLLSLDYTMLSFINTDLLGTYLQDDKHWLVSHSVVTEPNKVHSLALGIHEMLGFPMLLKG